MAQTIKNVAHFIEDMIGPSGYVSPEENAQMRQATPSDWQQEAERQEAQRQEDAARQEQQAMMDQRRVTIDENGAMFNNIAQIDAGVRQRAKQLQRRAAVGLLSAYKLGASVDGGRVPPSVYTMIGAMLGYDNETTGIGDIQVDMDGNMTISPYGRDYTGRMMPLEPIKLPFGTIYGMARENQGILTRDEMDALRGNAIRKANLTEDMANRMYPAVPEGYGDPNYVPVGGRRQNGALNVGRAFSRGPRKRGTISAFGANGRGGFTQYYSGEDTGHQLVSRDYGTRAEGDKGRWKVLRSGGGQTTYENDKTGDVVTVRDGETPPWVANSGTSEKERIAKMNNETRERVQQQRGDAQRDVAQVTADATKHKADASVEVAAQNGRAKAARGGRQSDAEDLASVRRILDKNSGATPDQRNAAINKLLGIADRYERDISTSDKDRALKKADDIIDLYGGDMSGFQIKDKEQIRKFVAGELYAGKEYDPDEWSSYFDSLRTQRAKNAQGAQKSGKAEKTGDNGGGARELKSPKELKDAPIGSWFMRGKTKYVKQKDGQVLPEE